jgi:hypothetical protein
MSLSVKSSPVIPFIQLPSRIRIAETFSQDTPSTSVVSSWVLLGAAFFNRVRRDSQSCELPPESISIQGENLHAKSSSSQDFFFNVIDWKIMVSALN